MFVAILVVGLILAAAVAGVLIARKNPTKADQVAAVVDKVVTKAEDVIKKK